MVWIMVSYVSQFPHGDALKYTGGWGFFSIPCLQRESRREARTSQNAEGKWDQGRGGRCKHLQGAMKSRRRRRAAAAAAAAAAAPWHPGRHRRCSPPRPEAARAASRCRPHSVSPLPLYCILFYSILLYCTASYVSMYLICTSYRMVSYMCVCIL